MQVYPPIIIKNAIVIDGSGEKEINASVIIRNSIVEDITTEKINDNGLSRTIDASGKIVCPGFIDIHAHGDLEPFAIPEAESKILNGVTTEVCGNCGSSPFPIINHFPGYLREKSEQLGIDICWTNAEEFLRELEKNKSAINRLFLVGHGRMRSAVIGADRREASPQEIDRMKKITEEAMRAGAWGLSTGLAYAPGCHSNTEEIVELCKVVADYGGVYTSHIRSEGDEIIKAIEEAFEIAEKSGVRLQISHLKISGHPNWENIDTLKKTLFSAYESGFPFGADWYPYEAWNANLDSILPDWVYEGGTARLLSRLRDPNLRRKLAEHVVNASKRGMSWDKVIVGTVTMEEHRCFQGRSIAEISEELGLSPEDTYFNLILAEGGRADGMISTMSEDIQREIVSWPFVSICSDATARRFDEQSSKSHFHPRTYGTASRFLRRVREENLMPLTDAIKKLTSLPASQIGLAGKGLLKKGTAADVVIFDPEKISDTATFKKPVSKPVGIDYVLVNGIIAVEEGRLTGAYPGNVLRKGGV